MSSDETINEILSELRSLSKRIASLEGALKPSPERYITPPAAALTGASSFGSGTYLVGIDIQPGIYVGIAEYDRIIFWERLASLSPERELGRGNAEIQTTVQILPTDFAFKSSNVAGWTRRG